MIGPKTPKPTAAEARRAYMRVDYRDSERCLFRAPECAGGVQRDHRKNRSQGGLTVVENLQLLCAVHHLWKTEHPEAAESEGWAVPGWGDPITYPARRWIPTAGGTYRLVWVQYTRAGEWRQIPEREALRRIREGRLYEPQRVPMNPDCRDGKHKACRGDAWDVENDRPAPCGCACHETGQAAS